MAKNRGCSMASRCHNYHLSEELGSHIFFSYNLANALWSWLLVPCGYTLLAPTFAAAIWEAISFEGDASGRQLVDVAFFHAISILWLLRNDSKHNGRKSTIERAKVIFVDRIRGMIISLNSVKVDIFHHPIFLFLGMVN